MTRRPYVRPSIERRVLSRSEVSRIEKLGPEAFLASVAPLRFPSECDRLYTAFRELFVGRDDAYLDEKRGCVKAHLSAEIALHHLHGRQRIGAYGLIPGDNGARAKFLVVDFDGKNLAGGRAEALRQANAVAQCLEELGLPAYLEESRSRLGFHVWVFFGPNLVPLEKAQQIGRLVVRIAGLPNSTEVFPKGSTDDPYGGTPYAPLHGLLSTRQTGTPFVRPDGSPHDDQPAVLSDVKCVTEVQIDEAIDEAMSRAGTEATSVCAPAGKNRVDVSRILRGVPEGQRDSKLFQLACKFRQTGIPQEAAEHFLVEAAAKCKPPFPVELVRKKVQRTYQRYLPGDSDVETWTPPTPFYVAGLPRFPTEVLPDTLRDFVKSEAEATQTPEDLTGGLMLAVLATTCARKVEVQVKPGWTEAVNLYIVTVLPPGTRKSAVFSHVVQPLEVHERRLAARVEAIAVDMKARREVAKERLAKARRDAARAASKDRERLEEQAVETARELAAITVPKTCRLIADDCSPERLATLLRDHGGRMAVMSPEGDVFDLMAGRYSAKGESNLGVYLKGHAGDTLRVDRVGRGSEFVPKPALTIGLAVQPIVLTGLAQRPNFRGRGLLGRFLYSIPRSPLGSRDVDPPSVQVNVMTAYHRIVHSLLETTLAGDDNHPQNDDPHLLRLTPGAWATLKGFLAWLEPRLAEQAELGTLTDWAGKLGGAVARIAGILHMVEHVDGPTPWLRCIEVHNVERAIVLGRYYLAHARAAFAQMGTDPEVDAARFILGWIEKNGITVFSKRIAFEGTKGRLPRAGLLDAPLELLVEHGYLRRETPPVERSGGGRRPSPVFRVNPLNSANSANSANHIRGGNGAPEDAGRDSANSAKEPEVSLSESFSPETKPILELECASHYSHYSHNSTEPRWRCRLCDGADWWRSPDGDWVCGSCQPVA